MQTVGIKDLKNRLSQMLSAVKDGEEVLVIQSGRPIARIVPEDRSSAETALAALAARGLVRVPIGTGAGEPELVEVRGEPLSETIIAGPR